MGSIKHKCIKPTCSNEYSDDDVEAYYCDSCREINKQIAEEIEKKRAMLPKNETKSSFKIYEELPKTRGFINAKDLGLL